jgi:hypothetical protein
MEQFPNHRACSLILCCAALVAAWSGIGSSRAATADAVVAWGNNGEGETTVPFAAQSGVTAIAAGGSYTLALKATGRCLSGDTTAMARWRRRPQRRAG